ncbi:MAG: hypothetical protein K6F09_09780 [Clostridiales bacterium]|nr:hypothetical protein [Clostridiales bacterium]
MKKKIFDYISDTLNGAGKYAKSILKYGIYFLLTLSVFSFTLYITAGRWFDMYTSLDVAEQLFLCIRPCAGLIAAGTLLFEYLEKNTADGDA